jgi:mannose-1-phosphate guanylyltransferase
VPERPKFLHDLRGTGVSLLQDTVARLAPVATRTMVVTGVSHAEAVREQLPALGDDDVVAEPSPRDSMAAIALAAGILEHRHGAHVFGSFAADHVILRPDELTRAIRIAIEAAEAGAVVTIGIEPLYPATGFGWILRGEPLADVEGAFRAEAFVEKPDIETAQAYLDGGRHYWNAGMFVTRTDVLLGHLARLQPVLHDGVRALAAAWDGPDRGAVLDSVWPTLTRIAIDHAIAEPVAAQGGVVVVPSDCDWIDVGDFAVLASINEPDASSARTGAERFRRVIPSPSGSMIIGGDRPVVIVGVDNVTVVDTPEALLILGRASAQRVKDAASSLEGA